MIDRSINWLILNKQLLLFANRPKVFNNIVDEGEKRKIG